MSQITIHVKDRNEYLNMWIKSTVEGVRINVRNIHHLNFETI